MGNLNTLRTKSFTTENQPANRGRKKGVPNRATVFKRLLKMKVEVKNPETAGKLKVTLYEAMALGQIQAAMKGNTRAWQEIQDSLFGKLIEHVALEAEPGDGLRSGIDLSQLSKEEVDQLERLIAKSRRSESGAGAS